MQRNSYRNTAHPNIKQTLTQGEKKIEAKSNDVWKENHFTISQESRLEKSQSRNWKNKRIIDTYQYIGEKENYKYLEISETDNIEQGEMKEKHKN